MNILLIQTGFIGDVVLSTPVISAIAAKYPGASIDFLTTPQAADLVRHHPQLNAVLVFDKRGARSGIRGLREMAAELRSRKYDIVFSLHKSWRTGALVWLSGIPVRYGFRRAKLRFLYTRSAVREDLHHEVLRNLAVLRGAGFEPAELPKQMHIEIPQETRAAMSARLADFSNRGYAAIAPGSVWATKRWTPEGFAGVAAGLINQGRGVVIIGAAADDAGADKLIQALDPSMRGSVINLVGKATLLESAAVIAGAELLVSNDSAPLHIASATGTPVVAVFCATVPGFGFGPWEVPHECVGVDSLSCRPCAPHGGQSCPLGTYACQHELSAAAVLGAARRVLSTAAGRLETVRH